MQGSGKAISHYASPVRMRVRQVLSSRSSHTRQGAIFTGCFYIFGRLLYLSQQNPP